MPAAKKGKTIDIGFNVKAGLDPESGKQIEQSLGSIITKINSTQTKVKVGVDLSGISAAQVSQQLKAMFSGAKVNLSDSVTFDSSKTEAFSASTKKAAKEATESAKEVEQAAVKFKEATGAITKLQMNSAERDTEKLFGKAADLQAAGEGYDKLSDSVMKVVEAKEKLAAQPTKANHEDFKIQLDNAKDLVAAYQKASNVPDILAAGDGADGKKDNISSLQLDKARRSTEDLFNQVSKINGTSNAYIALCNSVDKVVDAYSELENMPSKGNLDKFKMQIAETGDIQKAYQENITAARDNLRRTFSEQYKSGSGVDYKEWESQFEELGVGQARESQLAGADNQTAMLTRRTEALRGAELATNDLLYATEELNKANQVFQTTQDRADLDTVRARVSDVKDQQRVIAEMQHLFTKDDTIYKGDNSTANMVAFANSIKGTKFESEGLTASIERLKQAQDQLNSDHSRESLETWREQQDLCQGQINNVRRLQTEDRKLIQQDKERLSSALQYKNILAESQNYYSKYQDKISKNSLLNDKFKELFSNLQTGNFGSSTEARTNLADLRAETKALGLESVSTKQKLTELFGVHLDTAIAMAGVHALTQALQAAYQNIVDLDKKLVDLQVATGYSRKDAKELMSSYTQMGEALGATTSEVASAADDWLRQNKTINETNTLIKDSMMLAKLGQIDSKEATTDLTAVMKANICPNVQKCA